MNFGVHISRGWGGGIDTRSLKIRCPWSKIWGQQNSSVYIFTMSHFTCDIETGNGIISKWWFVWHANIIQITGNVIIIWNDSQWNTSSAQFPRVHMLTLLCTYQRLYIPLCGIFLFILGRRRINLCQLVYLFFLLKNLLILGSGSVNLTSVTKPTPSLFAN